MTRARLLLFACALSALDGVGCASGLREPGASAGGGASRAAENPTDHAALAALTNASAGSDDPVATLVSPPIDLGKGRSLVVAQHGKKGVRSISLIGWIVSGAPGNQKATERLVLVDEAHAAADAPEFTFGAVGDLDGDGRLEVSFELTFAKRQHCAAGFSYLRRFFILDADRLRVAASALVDSKPQAHVVPLRTGKVTLSDENRDGHADVVVAGEVCLLLTLQDEGRSCTPFVTTLLWSPTTDTWEGKDDPLPMGRTDPGCSHRPPSKEK